MRINSVHVTENSLNSSILRNFEGRLKNRNEISQRTLDALDFDADAKNFGDDEEILTAASGVEQG